MEALSIRSEIIMPKSDKPFNFKVAEKKPRQFNRLAAGTALGILIGVILAYTVGPKDYAVVIGTAVGALVGYLWDQWAERKKNKKK
ncbi:MAG: hypothetical protein CL609_07360 [Anaerolineaceae bacterium]|nr:hypothetical protein [Anaerolineaceae bacterium]